MILLPWLVIGLNSLPHKCPGIYSFLSTPLLSLFWQLSAVFTWFPLFTIMEGLNVDSLPSFAADPLPARSHFFPSSACSVYSEQHPHCSVRDHICSMAGCCLLCFIHRECSPQVHKTVCSLTSLGPHLVTSELSHSLLSTQASLLFCTSTALDFFIAFLTGWRFCVWNMQYQSVFDFWNIWRYIMKYLSIASESQQNSFNFHIFLG